MRLHRLLAILLLLEARKQVKAKELAEALEASERTIYRDIEVLCEAGIPIAATSGPSGGFSLMEGYSINSRDLQGDDIVNLYLSGIGVRPAQHTDASVRLTEAILRLERSLPREFLPDVQKARERFFFDPSPWWKERPELKFMDTLRRAVWDSRKLRLVYEKRSRHQQEQTERVIRPYGLVVKSMDWYLVAWCEERADLRVFRCERILGASLLDETFTIPDSFLLSEYWQRWTDHFKSIV